MDPAVIAAYLVTIVLIIVIPILVGYFVSKKLKVPWTAFIISVIFFFVVQVIHTPLVLLTQPSIMALLTVLGNYQLEFGFLAIVLGLLAGLFEEIGKYLVVKHYIKKKKIKPELKSGAMFGLGWGAAECVFVSGILVLSIISYMAIAPLTAAQIQDVNAAYGGKLTNDQLNAIETKITATMNQTPLDVLPALIERMFVIVLQLAFSLLVFKSVVLKKKHLLLMAILFHAVVDSVGVFSNQFNGIWVTELGLFIFAIIGLVYILRQFKKI